MDNGLTIIKRPLLSEKSSLEGETMNRVYFEVAFEATKPQIRNAVERFFNVTVKNVNTMVVAGKPYATRTRYRKGPKWKKAAVTLKEGDKIEFFKGV